MTPCRLVYRYRNFGLTWRWRQQDGCSTEVLVPTYQSTLHHIPEGGNLMYAYLRVLLLLNRIPDLNEIHYFKCKVLEWIFFSGLYWLPPVHLYIFWSLLAPSCPLLHFTKQKHTITINGVKRWVFCGMITDDWEVLLNTGSTFLYRQSSPSTLLSVLGDGPCRRNMLSVWKRGL
jgi:hypothetical protein